MIAADHRIPEFVFFRTIVDLWGAMVFLRPSSAASRKRGYRLLIKIYRYAENIHARAQIPPKREKEKEFRLPFSLLCPGHLFGFLIFHDEVGKESPGT